MLEYAPGEAADGFPSEKKWSYGIAGGSTKKAAGGGAHESILLLLSV